MAAQIEAMQTKIEQLEEELSNFTGSKLEDAYYEIDANINTYLCELDNITAAKGTTLREEKRKLMVKMNELSDTYDEKCKSAPSTLKSEEIDAKMKEFELILKQLDVINIVIGNYKGDKGVHKEIDEQLLAVFESANGIDANRHDGIEAERKRVVRAVQNSMLVLAQAYERYLPESNLLEVSDALLVATSMGELDGLWKKINELVINSPDQERRKNALKVKKQIRDKMDLVTGKEQDVVSTRKRGREHDDGSDEEMPLSKKSHSSF